MPELECSIVTPSKKVFEGRVDYISAPGAAGEFGVLPDHESFVTVLDVGIIEIQPVEGEKFKAVVVGGYFEVSENRVFIIADEIILKDDVDTEEARKESEKYKAELSSTDIGDAKYNLIQKNLKKYEKMLEIAS